VNPPGVCAPGELGADTALLERVLHMSARVSVGVERAPYKIAAAHPRGGGLCFPVAEELFWGAERRPPGFELGERPPFFRRRVRPDAVFFVPPGDCRLWNAVLPSPRLDWLVRRDPPAQGAQPSIRRGGMDFLSVTPGPQVPVGRFGCVIPRGLSR